MPPGQAGRPLVAVAAFLVIGLVLGERFSYFPLLVFGSLVMGLLLWRWAQASSVPLGLILLPLLFGLFYYQLAVRYRAASDLSPYLDQNLMTFEGQLADPVRHYPDRLVGILAVDKVLLQGEERPARGRVRLSLDWPESGFLPGDLLRIEAKLRSPLGFKNPGGFDYAEYLRRDGIQAVSTISHPERVLNLGKAPGVMMRRIAIWREKIRVAIANSLAAHEAAILQAMIIGESGYLTNEIRDAFMASGTTHILSISGSHLGLVAFVVFLLVRRSLRLLPAPIFLRLTIWLTPSQIAACVTFFPVVFYALIAGGQSATVRSLIMILLYLLAVILQREDDLLNALAFAAILTLLWEPQAIMDISFQLSYGSVLAMGLFLRWWEEHKPEEVEMTSRARLIRSSVLMLLLTLTTTVWTAPLVAYHFHQVAWVGLFSNLIIIPMAGFLIVPLGLISSVLVLIFNLDYLPLAWFNQHGLAIFDGLVQKFSRLPAAEFHLPAPSLVFIIVFYLLLFFLFWTKKIQTPRFLGGSLALVFGLLMVWGLLPRLPDRTLRISYLDVGQGDSALIEFPENKAMVIDGGGAFGDFDLGRIVVAPYLWDRRIHRIDYLVATHPQQDHLGGLSYLLKKFDIGNVWTNGTRRDTLLYQTFSQALDQKGLKEREMFRNKEALEIGGCRVWILNPFQTADSEGGGYRSKADNNRSVVLRLEKGDDSFLFTGDIEASAERMLATMEGEVRSRVLKVPHHGSRGALDDEFLGRVRPEIAIISVGAHNSYGHPAPEVLDAYQGLGAKLYRTDQEGAILISSDGEKLSIQT
ncbi:MAG TPA: DNA internalization-related competence protein ComEC/Rec2, partial [Nitrospiria bacterium]|nr:DNA internalization-related competence protein ComEC/Rec2 [Nitrospiria bacterium]